MEHAPNVQALQTRQGEVRPPPFQNTFLRQHQLSAFPLRKAGIPSQSVRENRSRLDFGPDGTGKTTSVQHCRRDGGRYGLIAFAGETIDGLRADEIARRGIGRDLPTSRAVFGAYRRRQCLIGADAHQHATPSAPGSASDHVATDPQEPLACWSNGTSQSR